jgi:sugar lactone lactonase YvrE
MRPVCGGAAAALLALGVLGPGCAAPYMVKESRPAIALQWPFQPNPAKVTYERSLTGLARRASGFRSALRGIVYGRDKGDENAFILPVAVATAADGRMAVADLGRRCVHLYIPEEERYVRLTGSERDPVVSPVAVAFGEARRLHLSDSAGTVFTFASDGTLERVIRMAGEEKLLRPTGVAWSPASRLLYVVDTLANRVHAFHEDGAIAFSFGHRGVADGEFNFPTHIARSAGGELFVTDALNYRVQIFDESGAHRGSFGRHGDGTGDLAMPKGLAVDGDGIIYLVDSLFDAVQLFDRGGRYLLTVGRRGVDFGEFWLPSGLFISDRGELFVCDTYNRRVQVYRITEGYADGGTS